MYKKQRLLLGLVQKLKTKNRLDNLTLMKCMFLLAKKFDFQFSMYSFHPYKYGPYSSKLTSDMIYLAKKGYLKVEDLNKSSRIKGITNAGINEALILNYVDLYLDDVLDKYSDLDSLIAYVYDNYSDYTIRSEWKSYSHKTELPSEPIVILLGYEGIDIDEFLHKLVQENVKVIIDVRANARSMKYNFNKKRLASFLSHLNIQYRHRPDLGIPSSKRKGLEKKADYEDLFDDYRKSLSARKEGLSFISQIAENNRIAILCFEKDNEYCHRREIGLYLMEKGYEVKAI